MSSGFDRGFRLKLRNIFSPEKKKLVLPVVAILVLASSVFSLYYIRMTGMDEQVASSTVEELNDFQLLYGEKEFYNISTEDPTPGNPLEDWTRNPVNLVAGGTIYVVYKSPFFVFEPSSPLLFTSSESGFLKRSEGYFLSKELPEALLKIKYNTIKSQEIYRKASKGEMNLSTYIEEMRGLGETDLNRTVVQRVEEFESEGSENLGVIANQEGEKLSSIYLDTGFREIQWYHFLPGILTTFLFWFVINAVLVEAGSKIREEV